ncbi:MAG: hypothetical protein AAGI91_05980 [Bacteroidota bacterium]
MAAPEAEACGCGDNRPWSEVADSSDVLFTGRMISHRSVYAFDRFPWLELPHWMVPHDGGSGYESMLFEVDRWWKGEHRQRIEVRTDHSSCAMMIPEYGQKMLIEAYAWDGILFTWLCARSLPVLTPRDLDSTLAALPEYMDPWLVTQDTLDRHLGPGYFPDSNERSILAFTFVVALLLLVGGAASWFMPRRGAQPAPDL